MTRIQNRDWNPATYGPTQKLVVILAQCMLNNDHGAVRMLLQEHCTESLLEYVSTNHFLRASYSSFKKY